MAKTPVRVIGGPLDGNVYELKGQVGERIDLNSAAGVCVYEFATAADRSLVLYFVGPGWPASS